MIHRSRARHIVSRMEAETIINPRMFLSPVFTPVFTIETDVKSREEEGDQVGEGPGVLHPGPEQGHREDEQGRAEVESVHIAEAQH